MEFDPISFLLGFGSASGLSYGLWRYRERIRNIQEAAGGQADSAREFLKRSADSRYAIDVGAYLQGYHLAGDYASLSEILIEPYLLAAPSASAPPNLDDDIPDDLTYVIPRVQDFPALHANYYLEAMPLTDVCMGAPHVAILGNTGMGKTTALVTLGLMALGEISFETMQSLTEQIIADEFKDLSDKEKAERRRELEAIEERAVEQLRIVQHRDSGSSIQEAGNKAHTPITNFFPIFIHLSDIDLDLNIYGIEVDPAEPLIRAFQQHVSLITGQAAPVLMYQHLARGDCLILIDGYDDLFPSEQARIYSWLQNFIAAYGKNRIVITGPAQGYDPLLHLGFAPTFIQPFSQLQSEQLIQRWVKVWPEVEKRKSGKRKVQTGGVDEKIVKRLLIDNRNRDPFETSLKILTALSGDEREVGRRGWFERYLRDFLPDQEHSPALIREMARIMLDRETLLKEDQIIEITTKRLTDDEEKPILNIEQFNKDLFNKGLFIKRAANSYAFRHPLMMAYFGAESLIHDAPQRVADVATNPLWQNSLSLAASALDLSPAIFKKLSVPPDLLFSNLLSIAHWIPDTPLDAKWRGEILKRLSAALLAPAQFAPIRERVVAALVTTRDPNVTVMLRQAIRSNNSIVRKLACIGLGALGTQEALNDLRPMLADDNREVQLAAGFALGAIGSERALEIMVQGLLQGEEHLRKVVAEALAGIPGEGQSVLRDAVEHQDMMVRRAAVFGLARIPQNWALVALYRAMLEDSQWYVRSAAEYAFARARDSEREGPRQPLKVEQLTWLSDWANSIGQGLPQGEKAVQLLVRALQEADANVKVLAAQSLGRVGILSGLKPLYNALSDKNEQVRAAAFEALGYMQLRMTKPLPSIV